MSKKIILATIVVLIDIFIGFMMSPILAGTILAINKLNGILSIISITIIGLIIIALDLPIFDDKNIYQKYLKENKCIYIFYPNGKATAVFSNGHKAHLF